MKKLCVIVIILLISSVMPVMALDYGDITLTTTTGNIVRGHFPDVWDLTAGDITISFTYGATGLNDDYGASGWPITGAHAWSILGVRDYNIANSDYPCTPTYWIKRVDLMAGGGNEKSQIDAGDVFVQRIGDTLYVRFVVTEPDWFLLGTHVAIGDSLDDIPQTAKGNPIPGQFEFSDPHPPVAEYTYAIDVSGYPASKKLFIVAHAKLGHMTDGLIDQTATGWGYMTGEFVGKNWATYFTYKPTAIPLVYHGIWFASDYDGAINTFDPDPVYVPGSNPYVGPTLDIDDKLLLQECGYWDESWYDLYPTAPEPPLPIQPGSNYGIWFDRDGVDPWQPSLWGAVDGGTYNTGGIYDVVITLHANNATTGTAYMTVNGIQQGFYNGPWFNGQPPLYPAGRAFVGDMQHLQIFYGIEAVGTVPAVTQSVTFTDIIVSQ